MKIAILGAGFSGLAVAWELLSRSNFSITIFDSKPIGKGTSGIAAGLLHPYAGAHAKLNWRGHEGVQATLKFLAVASHAIDSPVASQDQGMIRLALTEQQQTDFFNSPARKDPSVEWIDADQFQSMIPAAVHAPGLWIKNALSIYPQFYLLGLWKACQARGAQFIQTKIESLEELDSFDARIVAAGAETCLLPECSLLPLKVVKGQILEFEWPDDLPPLPCALNSQAYILMTPNKKSCLVGSTFEKTFSDDLVDLEVAKSEIIPKAAKILPFLKEAKIAAAYSGLRAVSPNHLPMIKAIDPKTWTITGMGSKALIYHGLMAEELASRILEFLRGCEK